MATTQVSKYQMMTTIEDENVYNYIRPEEALLPEPNKAPRYQSKFASLIREEFRKGRQAHYSMGEARVEPPNPEEFLKRRAGEHHHFQQRVKSARGHRDKDPHAGRPAAGGDHQGPWRRPPVPKVTDHIATPFRTRRSFVHKNALEAMLAEPPRAADQKFVDSPRGNAQYRKASGMVPVHRDRPDFGRVPGYLRRMKMQRDEEQRRWEEEQERAAEGREAMKLHEDERQAILEGLRRNWSELHHTYQGLSLLTDTLPKKLRRERIEQQLDEIERFIDLLEKHPVIMITDSHPLLYSC